MEDIVWILGIFSGGVIGFVFGIYCAKWGYESDLLDMREDIFDIVYDYGVHPYKKASSAVRLTRVDKYFGLDEIRQGRPDHEPMLETPKIATDNISQRLKEVV